MTVATELPSEWDLDLGAETDTRCGPARSRLAVARPIGAPAAAPRRIAAVPPRSRPDRRAWAGGRDVAVLRAPAGAASAAPVRLTRRGAAVVAAALALGCAAIWWIAAQSAPGEAATPQHVPRTVTVAPGDTLWAIAARVAPQRDPRAEVAELQQRNHLVDAAIVPGQVLRLR